MAAIGDCSISQAVSQAIQNWRSDFIRFRPIRRIIQPLGRFQGAQWRIGCGRHLATFLSATPDLVILSQQELVFSLLTIRFSFVTGGKSRLYKCVSMQQQAKKPLRAENAGSLTTKAVHFVNGLAIRIMLLIGRITEDGSRRRYSRSTHTLRGIQICCHVCMMRDTTLSRPCRGPRSLFRLLHFDTSQPDLRLTSRACRLFHLSNAPFNKSLLYVTRISCRTL